MRQRSRKVLIFTGFILILASCDEAQVEETSADASVETSGGVPFSGEPSDESEENSQNVASEGGGNQFSGGESGSEDSDVRAACGFVGGPCDDLDPCTSDDTCRDSGDCKGDAILCEDGIICTEDYCSEGTCIHAVVPDYCLIEGSCYPDETVNPEGGCSVCDAQSQPEAWTLGGDDKCDDGDACTLNDKCSGNGCAGTPIPCDDGDACTIDSCNEGQCVFSADPDCGALECSSDGECNDGSECTMDFCDNESCIFVPIQGCVEGGDTECETTADCTNIDPCKIATCISGECVVALQSDIPCEDGDSCTVGDTCVGGQCSPGANLPDVDEDGFPAAACGGTDCDDTTKSVAPNLDENCSDGVDNDCNQLIDGADPFCDMPSVPQECNFHKECEAHQLCGYWSTFGNERCSDLCASTSDCGEGLICGHVPGSANVGICRPSLIPGAKSTGAQCSAAGECESEVCAGICATFCSDEDACPGASTCFAASNGDGILGVCAPDSTFPGGIGQGQMCGNNGGTCFSGHCDFLGDGTCAPICGTDGDCAFNQECGVILRSNSAISESVPYDQFSFNDATYDTMLGCFARPGLGSAPVGSVCTVPDQCRSNKCLPINQSMGDNSGYCTAFCTGDTDCPGAMVCRPGVTTVASNWLATYGQALETSGTIARICKFQ